MSPIVLDPTPVAAGTEIVLDPAELAVDYNVDRVELHLNAGAIRVAPEGIDWGDAAIEQHLADQTTGQIPVGYRTPNRQIQIPLLVGADGAANFPTAVANLRAKVALIQREGRGWLKRGTGRYCDLVNATLRLPDRNGWLGVEADVILTLEALPDFYGDEQTLAAVAATGGAPLVATFTGVDGDHPARVRIVVDEDSSQDQRGVIWGIRSRHYSADATAALVYQAESLTPLDAATLEADATAYGSGNNTVEHASLSTSWLSVLSTDHATHGALTHTGTYRVWARVKTQAATPPTLRLLWDIGDLIQPVENTEVEVPGSEEWHEVNLGEIHLAKAPIGTHQWRGLIQARGAAGGEDISIDRVELVPVDDGYGELRAPTPESALTAGYYARDDFAATTTGNNLHGRTPPVGAAWATSGVATDFQFIDPADAVTNTTEAVSRSASSASFRYAVFGAAQTDMEVRATIGHDHSHYFLAGKCGVIARWTDANNYVRCTLERGATSGFTAFQPILRITKVVAGVETDLVTALASDAKSGGTIVLTVTAQGRVTGAVYSAAGAVLQELAATDSDLATSGALDDGLGGIIDSGTGSHTTERWYGNVAVSEPTPTPAVIFADSTLELRTDGMYRATSGGTAYGPVPHVIGGLPRLPPSGLEDRTVEVFVKASRGDLSALADTGLDGITATVHYRPCWLYSQGG